MLHTRCPHCNVIVRADLAQRGRLVVCPSCSRKFTCEALPWWQMVFRKRAKRGAAKTSERKERAKVRPRARTTRASGPYERVDESILAEIAAQRRSRAPVVVLLCLIVVLVAVAIVVFTFPIGPVPRPARSAAPLPEGTPIPPLAEPPPAPAPPEGAIFAAPDYAYHLERTVEAAGYTPRKGAKWTGREAYCFGIRELPRVYFAAFPEGDRVIAWAVVAPAAPEQERELPPQERGCILKVFGKWLTGPEGDDFASWMKDKLPACLEAAAAGKDLAAERRFGQYVLRAETCEHPTRGRAARVELARAYRPASEIEGFAPLRDWSEMRAGVTLEEVEAFAGPGERVSTSGSGEWMVERFVWPGNREVIFRNGRAISWKPPLE